MPLDVSSLETAFFHLHLVDEACSSTQSGNSLPYILSWTAVKHTPDYHPARRVLARRSRQLPGVLTHVAGASLARPRQPVETAGEG